MKTLDFKHYISLVLIALAVVMVSCSDSDNNAPEASIEENTIDFTINFEGDNGEALSSQGDLSQFVTVKYKGVTYAVVEGKREAGKIGFNLITDNDGKKQLVFGGIDGTKEVENEKILIDCANGTTNEITFSNKKVVGRSGEDFVRTYSFNGQPLESPDVICPFEYNSYLATEQINGGVFNYLIKIKMLDKSGNDLLADDKFRIMVKEGTTFTFRGVTSPIVAVDKIYTDPNGYNLEGLQEWQNNWEEYKKKTKYKLKIETEKKKDGTTDAIVAFGYFSTIYFYRDQELVINWFDGSKDVVKFTLIFMPKYFTDPTYSSYNPEAPQQEFNMTCNGEEVTYGTVPPKHITLQFTINKTFDWWE